MRWLVCLAFACVTDGVAFAPAARADSEASTCADAAEHAQPLRREGKLSLAKEQLARCARASCPAAVQSDCTRWLSEVISTMPSIVVRAQGPDGADAIAVTVIADGHTLATQLDGKPIFLDPGEHTLRYELAGAEPVETRVLLVQGERDRIVRVALTRSSAKGLAPAPNGTPRDAPHERTKIPLASWILGGVSAAAIGTGVAFYAVGLDERSTLANTCAPSHSCDDGRIASARNKLIAGDVLVGVGIVTVAASLYLALTRRTSTESSRASAVTPAGLRF